MEKWYSSNRRYRLGRVVALVLALFALLFTASSPGVAAPDGRKAQNSQQLANPAQSAKPLAHSSASVPGQYFQDIAPGSFWYNYTAILFVEGMVSGYPCGQPPAGACVPPDNLPYYLPNNTVSRGEMSRYINNARSAAGININETTGIPGIAVAEHNNYYAITSTNTYLEGVGVYGESAGVGGSGNGLSILAEGVYGYSSAMSYSVGLGAYSNNFTAAWFDEGDYGYYNTFLQKGGLLVGDVYSPTSNINDSTMNGNLTVAGTIHGHFSEMMRNTGTSDLHPGDIVVAGADVASAAVLGDTPVASAVASGKAYDTGVLGIVDQRWVQGDPNASTTLKTHSGYFDSNTTVIHPGEYMGVISLGTYKSVRVTARNGPIHVGDLLTTSDVPGVAMKVGDKDRANAVGAIVGKALGNLDSGSGAIPIMVTLK